MQKTIFKIKRIEIENFRPKELRTDLRVIFDKDGVEGSLVKEFILRNPIEVTNKLLYSIKGIGKFIVTEEDDDILKNIYITRIEDEESVEERMLIFFKHLCEKAIKLKNIKSASQYMKLFNEIKVKKLEF